jgi:hypothetical protein
MTLPLPTPEWKGCEYYRVLTAHTEIPPVHHLEIRENTEILVVIATASPASLPPPTP